MEQQKPISHIAAGLIIAGILIVISAATSILGLSTNRGVGLLQPLVILVALIFLIRLYGKAHDYNLTFGNLFAYGFKATTVFTLLSVAFTIIFLLLFPDLKEKSFEVARQQLEDNPNISDDQIDQMLEVSRKYFWVGIVGGSVFFTVVQGAIGSLIGAAVTKKRPRSPFEQTQQL
ncbi:MULTISPECIES: DUF4199 domain-containing protein [Chitinophagaceae]|uniref:DUF4199 domain-containing protein n=1 Tax=Chitinophagaceae TaxID=563835 RepID=UPI000DEEBA1E|nr:MULTISPECIES: DUF4199 domain-containing protein [Chitinophagaceae]RPD51463.1 DUF4199 domain-containing protein [Paracnuella aquatica]